MKRPRSPEFADGRRRWRVVDSTTEGRASGEVSLRAAGRRRLPGAVLAAGLLGTVLTGCSTGGDAPSGEAVSCPAGASAGVGPTTGAASFSGALVGGVPTPVHTVVVVFENKSAADVVGTAAAPYLTDLATRGAALTNAHGVTHPSQPNYVALFSGCTHGVSDDSCPHRLSGGTLAGQLLAAGRTFVGYSEALPVPGFTGCRTGDYARKHNPWVDFPALPQLVNQPLTALPADFSALPTVAFVVPDLCHDMHDCSVATGDGWARDHLAGYVGWAQSHDSLLVVTFDEDEGSSANHIPTFLVGPMVRPGVRSAQRVDHYSLLRTLENMYGLPPLQNAVTAVPVSGVWTSAAAAPPKR